MSKPFPRNRDHQMPAVTRMKRGPAFNGPAVFRPGNSGVPLLLFGLLGLLLLTFVQPPCTHGAGQGGTASLQQIRYWAKAKYTRVVLDLDRRVDYEVHRLRADRSAGLPPRIYIDLFHTHRSENLPSKVGLDQGPVRCIRAAHRKKSTERLVLDLRQAEQYKVFRLDHPHRIVMDLWWTDRGRAEEKKKQNKEAELKSVHKALPPLIVIDPGHGGKDPGAVGKRGLKEKDVVFSIAKRLKRSLEKNGKARVLLTRTSDKFLELEDRTRFANRQNADLFISIHANASRDRKAKGVETYYLDNTTDKAAIRLARIENRTAKKKLDDLQQILQGLRLNSNAIASNLLAHTVQGELIRNLRNRHKKVKDLGSKGNLFYVLLGAHMPSILVEVSFISNPTEEKRLRNASYQDTVARGIANGVNRFLKKPDVSYMLAGRQ